MCLYFKPLLINIDEKVLLLKLKFVKPIGGFHSVSAVFPTLKDIIDFDNIIYSLNHALNFII